MPAIVCRLQSDLNTLIGELSDLIRGLPIKQHIKNYKGVVFIAPDYYWGEHSTKQTYDQLAIKRDYDEWFEIFRSLFANPTDDLSRKIDNADKSLRVWIELGTNWSLTPNRKTNDSRLRADADELFKILAIASASGSMPPILVPDTNAMASNPEPIDYRDIADGEGFVFLLVPTVLAELDSLKNSHQNPDFRKKVRTAITRIKGWRNQGILRNGVTVDRTITVKAIANEPDMQDTLTWLDKSNRDDRLVATVLEVQAIYPTARVILVTGDINLTNKADVARIETSEIPEN